MKIFSKAFYKFTTAVLLFTTTIAMVSCDDSSREVTEDADPVVLDIDAYRVSCQGIVEQQCYRVKYTDDREWSLFYDEIIGFNYGSFIHFISLFHTLGY